MDESELSLSKLAFGTSGIMGASLTNRGRLRLLDAALDHGITHFDTAPLYGQGDAEKVLGRFLVSHRSRVTVATKFGLFPRRYPTALNAFKPVARAINRRIKNLQQKGKQVEGCKFKIPAFDRVENVIPDTGNATEKYSSNQLSAQLERSLCNLKTDHLDILFLHDVSLSQLSDSFVQTLEQAKNAGKTLHLGLATSRARTVAILDTYPQLGKIIQVPATRFTTEVDDIASVRQNVISHSVFRHDFGWLLNWLRENKDRFAGIEGSCVTEVAAQLLLQRIYSRTPSGTVLFSSANVENISRNVAAINRPLQLLDDVLLELTRDAHSDDLNS